MEKTLSIDENKLLLKALEKLYIKKNNLKYFNSINFDYENSSINRYIKIIDIHNNIKISKVNTIYTVLKLQRGSESINYAYIYGVVENNKVINKYLITSNSSASWAPSAAVVACSCRSRTRPCTSIKLGAAFAEIGKSKPEAITKAKTDRRR